MLLVDRRREEELGEDSCDFVEDDGFELSAVDPPEPPEACPPLRRIDVLSPDTQTRIHMPEFPYRVIDRKLLARRLLGLAREAGAEILTQCIVSGAEVEKGFVTSVATDRGTFRCRLTVGASGLDRVICRDLPRGMGIPRRLRTSDYVSIYRETRELESDSADKTVNRGVLEYYVGRYGGYSWVYAGDNGTIDIGTAVQDAPGSPDPREIVHGFVRSNPAVGEKVTRRGGGRIPTRRPLNTMVTSGMLVIGDSACQATPVIGRGVGGAMIGAAMAADAAAFGLEAGDVSAEGLWSYNYNYMRDRGANMAALDCMRIFMQRMPEKDFAWALSKGVIGEQEMMGALVGRFEVPKAQTKFVGLVRGLRGMPILVRFDNALRLAQKVRELYRQYPREYDPPDFAEWSQEADFLFEDLDRI